MNPDQLANIVPSIYIGKTKHVSGVRDLNAKCWSLCDFLLVTDDSESGLYLPLDS